MMRLFSSFSFLSFIQFLYYNLVFNFNDKEFPGLFFNFVFSSPSHYQFNIYACFAKNFVDGLSTMIKRDSISQLIYT